MSILGTPELWKNRHIFFFHIEEKEYDFRTKKNYLMHISKFFSNFTKNCIIFKFSTHYVAVSISTYIAQILFIYYWSHFVMIKQVIPSSS